MESNLLRASALVVFGSISGLLFVVSYPRSSVGPLARPATPGLQIYDRLRGRWLASLAEGNAVDNGLEPMWAADARAAATASR